MSKLYVCQLINAPQYRFNLGPRRIFENTALARRKTRGPLESQAREGFIRPIRVANNCSAKPRAKFPQIAIATR